MVQKTRSAKEKSRKVSFLTCAVLMTSTFQLHGTRLLVACVLVNLLHMLQRKLLFLICDILEF